MNTVANEEILNRSTNLVDDKAKASGWFGGFINAYKQSRFAQILSGLLAIQLVLFTVLGLQSSRQGEFAVGEPLFSTSVDTINKIEIADADNKVTLIKASEQWQIDGETKLPVQDNKVENILSSITTLKTGLPVANSESAREQLKVAEDDFVRRVTLSGDGMEPTTVLLGTSPGLRKSHLRRDNTNEIYSASLPVSDLPSTANDWLNKDLLSFSEITEIEANEVRFSLTSEGDDKIWTISKPSDEQRKIDSAKLETVVTALQGMRISGIANAESQTDKDASTEVVEVKVVSKAPETTLTIEKVGEVVTIKRDDVPGVFTMAAAQFEPFSALNSMDDFMLDDEDAKPTEDASQTDAPKPTEEAKPTVEKTDSKKNAMEN